MFYYNLYLLKHWGGGNEFRKFSFCSGGITVSYFPRSHIQEVISRFFYAIDLRLNFPYACVLWIAAKLAGRPLLSTNLTAG